MDKLSVEILSSIFFYLHYEQKKQCKLVCRYWAKILQSSDLETVMLPIFIHPKYPSRIYRIFVKKVPNKTGCRRLSLGQFHDKAKLARLLPNLRFLAFLPDGLEFLQGPHLKNDVNTDVDNLDYFKDRNTGKPRLYTNEQIKQFENWHNRLETLVDISFTTSFLVFLDTGIFRRLTTLILTHDSRDFEMFRSIGMLFDKLKNTPNLKLLEINQTSVNVIHLEKLHLSLPLLETLRFRRFAPIDVLGRDSLHVKTKALSLKKLELDVNNFGSKVPPEILQYALLKYPDLQEFRLAVRFTGVNNALENFFQQFLNNTKNTLTLLKVDIPTEMSNIVALLQENGMLSLTTLELKLFYDHRQQWEQQRESLIIQIHSIISFVEMSNVRSLSLINVPDMEFDVLNKLDKLKELRLAFRNNPTFIAELDSIIKKLPQSLETLALSEMYVFLKEKDEKPFISGIKRLELRNCQVKSDLSDYLSIQLPKLRDFILKSTFMAFNLRLRHRYLSLVDINITQGTWRKFVSAKPPLPCKTFLCNSFKATVGDTTRIYSPPDNSRIRMNSENNLPTDLFDVHDHSMYHLHEPTDMSLDENEPYFHFQCESVQTFLYNSYLILV